MRVSDLASLFNGAHHFHLHPVGKLQVKELMAELGIVLVEFIELALLEEQDGIIVVLLDSPELSIARLVNQFETVNSANHTCFSKLVKVFHALEGIFKVLGLYPG